MNTEKNNVIHKLVIATSTHHERRMKEGIKDFFNKN